MCKQKARCQSCKSEKPMPDAENGYGVMSYNTRKGGNPINQAIVSNDDYPPGSSEVNLGERPK